MPPIIKLKDQKDLVPCSNFPSYAKFPFENFNPVQSRIFEVYNKNANCIIAAPTAAGKTVCAEQFMAHEVRERGGKTLFLAPMKALAKEKIDDWTSSKHHFSDLKLSILTGDYQLTPDRKKELAAANIIIMTSEMLNSRSRNFNSEGNTFLKEIGTVVVDESHLLTVPGRGDHLEVGLMKFCQLNPTARIVFLSATMPNVDELAEWVSYTLTGNDTYLFESTWRPCPLGVHYETYEQKKRYDWTEEEKVRATLNIINDYDDKFLVFVHTKRTGNMLKSSLKKSGVDCEFHNADLDKEKRHQLEKKFKEDPKFKVLIATSTMAWGVNTSARRVIVVGVHRGLSEVESYDVWQMIGRSGRPGFDPRGDAYILLPDADEDRHYNRINKNYKISSRLLDYVGTEMNPHFKCLAFHLVSEIHHGGIKTKEDVFDWYEKSLAHFQAKELDSEIVDSTLDLLIKYKAIREENGEYKVTPIGRISSMFYYSPFDVAGLKENLGSLFSAGAQENDLAISMALANVDSIRMGIVSKLEKEEMSAFIPKVTVIEKLFGTKFTDTVIKGGYAYHNLLNGKSAGAITPTARNLQFDFPRLVAVLKALDSMNGKWGQTKWMDVLAKRVSYGVKSNLIPFCQLPNVGKVRANKLWDAGLRNLNDVATNLEKVQIVLKMKRDSVEDICNQAKMINMMS